MNPKSDSHHLPLSAFLKHGTASVHDTLDKRIMELAPFANRERFARFLRVQVRLHHAAAPLYRENPVLARLLPGLWERSRLDAVVADCEDLGVDPALLEHDKTAATVRVEDNAEALGWLYTCEGSTLGAAILLKVARDRLGLSEHFGARHLAGHPAGRAPHWRHFKAALDDIALCDGERERALAGAREAFSFVRGAVEELMRDEQVMVPR